MRSETVTFSHSGMVGDIIYALPAIRVCGGGELFIYPRRPHTHMTEALTTSLAALMEVQPYVSRCVFSDQHADIDLDNWVGHYTTGLTIADMALLAVGASTSERNFSWLHVPKPRKVAPVVMHRSSRYRNERFPWRRIREKYHSQAIMVGLPDEHAAFCEEVGDVAYYRTENYLELAEVIAGCELFIGNQSSPYAIAEALKKPTLQEVSLTYPNCIFERPTATFGVDETVLLPDIL